MTGANVTSTQRCVRFTATQPARIFAIYLQNMVQ